MVEARCSRKDGGTKQEQQAVYIDGMMDGSGSLLARWRGEVMVTVVDLKTSEAELIDPGEPFYWSMASYLAPG